ENSASASDLQFKNNIIASCNTPLAVASGSTFNISAWFNDITFGNSIQYNNANLTTDPYATTPNFLPVGGSILLSGADFTGLNLSSFQQVTYRGAFGTSDWTLGWANWDPQNTAY
nr:T9SS C-terminal target domain-containing protein [Bacteroidia bacterium]